MFNENSSHIPEIKSTTLDNKGENNEKIFELTKDQGKGAGEFYNLYIEDKILEKQRKELKSNGGYSNLNYRTTFSNKETGLDIGVYDEDFFAGGPADMNYYNGLFFVREDGTCAKGPVIKWRGSKGPSYEDKISSVKSVEIKNNKVFANIEFDDGSIRSEEMGIFELPPVYAVYRNNSTYNQAYLSESIDQLKKSHKISGKFIFDQGTEIKENDEIKSIPDNAVIITDAAALRSIPELQNKKIIRIEGFVKEGGFVDLEFYAKKINSNPSKIVIFRPSCSDHISETAGIGDIDIKDHEDEKYALFLKEKLQTTFPNSTIDITDNPDDLKSADIRVVDRHRSSIGEELYNNKKTLQLPPSENESALENEAIGNKKDEIIFILDKNLNKIEEEDNNN